MRLGVEAALVDGRLVPGDVEVDDGRIARSASRRTNGAGIAAPGFVDLQVNGFGGVDFLDADADGYRRAGEALLETGVTAYLPTFITAPEDQLDGGAARSRAADTVARGSLGVHLEGPFLAPRRLGTHPASARRDPDTALLERLLAAGPVRLVTLAPELPGAGSLIDLLQARGVTVSFGHTDATAAEANAAFDRGVRTVTHLFNAMRPFRHRDPGIVRRRARARRRRRPGDPRRHPPRARDGEARVARGRRARRARHGRDRRRGARRRLVQPRRLRGADRRRRRRADRTACSRGAR